MITSPIKTIIKNLTDQKFTTPINSGLRIAITANGEKGDTAIISGDVFTMMDRTPVAEALISAILTGKVSLEYVIDRLGKITENSNDPNINSSVTTRDKIAKLNKLEATKEVAAEATDVVVDVATPTPECTVVSEEENAVSEAIADEQKQTPAEDGKNQNTESVAPADPSTEKAASKEAPKSRRQRQIKLN